MVITLLSPNFKAQPATLQDLKFASIIWGLILGIGLLTAWRITEQMLPMFRRGQCATSLYLWLVWIVWLNNMVQSVMNWTFMDGIINPGFPIFFSMIITWTLQTQITLQIILNRASLIMVNKRKAMWLKLGTAVVVGIINISVFCIWIPARLQISEEYIAINRIWDRIEKVIFLLIDVGLNGYFLYLVKSRLISQGLDKYKPLFNFNSGITVVSLSMDILLIAMMDLHNSFSYIAFHTLAYMVKLYIELILTELLIRVVRSSSSSDHTAGLSRVQAMQSGRHQQKQPNVTISSDKSQMSATLRNSSVMQRGEVNETSSMEELHRFYSIS